MALNPGRVPPNDIETEKALLGALMINANAVYDAADVVRSDSFYAGKHRTIYDAIVSLYNKGEPIDVVFPMMHGPNGEDGTMQGLLELARVAYVGAGATASALAMDKLAMKTLCAGAGIPQVEFLSATGSDAAALDVRVRAAFGYPCYVKPANCGSHGGRLRILRASVLINRGSTA